MFTTALMIAMSLTPVKAPKVDYSEAMRSLTGKSQTQVACITVGGCRICCEGVLCIQTGKCN